MLGVVPVVAVMPVRVHVEPDVLVRGAAAAPPMAVRFAVTVEMLLSLSVTVQVRVVVVELFAVMELGEKEQADTAGGLLSAMTVRVAVLEPVADEESVAVMVRDFAPVAVPRATVMPLRDHVEPDVLLRGAVGEPPIALRSTATLERLPLASVTVQVRVVVETALGWSDAGENEQVDTTGAELTAETVSAPDPVPVFEDESVAVMVSV